MTPDDVLEELTRAATSAPLPQSTTRLIETALVDTVGCMIAGLRADVTGVAADTLPAPRNPRPRPLLRRDLDLEDAVYLGVVAAHAWDYDDAAFGTHPSCILVPLLLALREDGRLQAPFADAYAAGYQAYWELSRRSAISLHGAGWHPTAALGTVAATAALCRARRLPATTTRHALALAAGLSGGVVGSFGSHGKALQVGAAARRAFEAVRLAEAGAIGTANALAGGSGLLDALTAQRLAPDVAPQPTLTALLEAPPSVKRYPVCYASHRVIDGVLELRRREGLAGDEVVSARARISEASARILRDGEATPGGAAIFSLPFHVANAAVTGGVTLDDTSRDPAPAVRELMTRVTVETSAQAGPHGFDASDRVWLTLRDGRTLDSGEVAFALGSPEAPLTVEALHDKFMGCATFGGMPPESAAATLDALGVIIQEGK